MNIRKCPVCQRCISHITRWRGIYICTPCSSKFEKIESILKNGQYLNFDQLGEVLAEFGEKELKDIESSKIVIIKKKPGRKKEVIKNNEVNIKPSTRKRKI